MGEAKLLTHFGFGEEAHVLEKSEKASLLPEFGHLTEPLTHVLHGGWAATVRWPCIYEFRDLSILDECIILGLLFAGRQLVA